MNVAILQYNAKLTRTFFNILNIVDTDQILR